MDAVQVALRESISKPQPAKFVDPPHREATLAMLEISEEITFIRQSLGLKYAALARYLGVDRDILYLWEKGRASPRGQFAFTIHFWADKIRKAMGQQ